jgi:G3E family GTPase
VTGFLGSGKTTLISRLLGHRELAETAVIVNELGEVAIDHHLLRRVDERTVLLGSGCVCCTLRGDLVDELRDLLDRADAGEIPRFRRVVVETTGVADPAPLVGTLLSEPFVRSHYALDGLVATVDAVNGLAGPEAVRQVAAAETIVVTKGDLVPAGALAESLHRLNPAATVLAASFGDVAPSLLLGRARDGRSPGAFAEGVERDGHLHESGIATLAVVLDEEVDWTAFGIWLTMLLHARGADVLRVKGLLDTGGPGPLLLNGVQHVVHPPEHLPAWPDDDRRSRIVFIGRDLDGAALERSLRAFLRAAPARPARRSPPPSHR